MNCFIRACRFDKDGVCSQPTLPGTTGCALTWLLTGKMPDKDLSKDLPQEDKPTNP